MEDVVSHEEMVDADASTNEAVDTDEEAQHKIVVKLERARMSVLNWNRLCNRRRLGHICKSRLYHLRVVYIIEVKAIVVHALLILLSIVKVREPYFSFKKAKKAISPLYFKIFEWMQVVSE